MIARLALPAVLCSTALLPSTARAGEGTTTDTDPEAGLIIPTATVETSSGAGGGGSGPSCSWAKHENGAGIPAGSNGSVSIPGTREGVRGTEVLYLRSCGPGSSAFVYVPPVDVAALRVSARRIVERQLPLPTLNMSPAPGRGGLIRMQNWLAVEPVADVSATAAVGPVWVTMTASQDSLLWGFGDGGSVGCDGIGSPPPAGADLLDEDVNGAAPCGYTFEHVSAPEFGANDDLAYENTVTTSWSISWVDYTGAAGTEPAISRTSPWSFQVRQIQTQRTAGDD